MAVISFEFDVMEAKKRLNESQSSFSSVIYLFSTEMLLLNLSDFVEMYFL
jgi:hypothetical protein